MKKVLNYFIGIITALAVVAILNGIVNYFFLWENNGDKYYKQYIKESKQIKIRVDEKYFDEKISHTSYLKYIIFFKGVMGGSRDYMFVDSYTHRYFKIMRFDLSDQRIVSNQNTLISGKELYVIVNIDEFNNPRYGSITNPIHIFSYKGVAKPIQIWWGGENRETIYKSIEPTKEEYEYNVINYLTYVMPAKEFKERFEK
ncbi:hypothetical protein [Flavobacterium sp. 1355]|uniref:hypothetical protein n=1 Tax=Flavobacterium sp. 1355 TaxID=2806571 RepID=UPI001AE108D9|nr:hypothetical protein [Flavobacterium sp. 1355]MBP1221978.1 hypothetical protein [Flavobacterium sp. 1355]